MTSEPTSEAGSDPGAEPSTEPGADSTSAPTSDRALRWTARPVETALAAVGGLALAALGFTVDPTGRWLVWAAAALLFGVAAMDVLLRPRLSADDSGVTVRSLGGRMSVPWSKAEVEVRRHQRLGRSVPTLELDLDAKLIILGRRELGADPEEVGRHLARLRDGAA